MRIGPRMSDTEQRIGPVPFSAEWIDDPPPPDRPRRVRVGMGWLPASLPGWLPSERLLSAFLVLAIILATAAFSSGAPAGRQLDAPAAGAEPVSDVAETGAQPAAVDGGGVPVETDADVAGATTDGGAAGTVGQPDPADAGVAGTTGSEVAGDQTTTTSGEVNELVVTTDEAARSAAQTGDFARDADGNLLPENRIVAVYGFPTDANMGILGEYGPEDIQGLYDEVLMPLVDQWEEADPSRPVIPAFEVIVGVAQGAPQADGSYLAHGNYEVVREYIQFAAENDMIVLIDTQMGKNTIEQELETLRPLLEYPNVHLAIDPEFSIVDGEEPGVQIGQMDASDINLAQQAMADLSVELDLPGKIVMVHQFHYTMIENKENLEDVPGVELVIHADGHGDPASKQVTYEVMVTEWVEEIPFRYGFKIWLNNDSGFGDEPRMEPVDMMELDPVPDIITHQ